MKTSSILLVPFLFARLTNRKVRPCVLICRTNDKYSDLVIAAISSVVPNRVTENEILIQPSTNNGLRKESVIKVDRIVTIKGDYLIAHIGELDNSDSPRWLSGAIGLRDFKKRFKDLVE